MYSLLIVDPIVCEVFMSGTCFCILSSCTIIVLGRQSVLLIFIVFRWHVAVIFLCLFLTASSVSLQCVIVVFLGHAHLSF